MKESLEIRDEDVAGKRAAYHPVIKKRSTFHRTVETEVDFTENTHSKGWSWNGFAPVAFLFFFWWASLAFTGGAAPVAHADFDEIRSDLSSSSEEVVSFDENSASDADCSGSECSETFEEIENRMEEEIDPDNGDDVDDLAEEDEGSCEGSECDNSSSSVVTTLKDRGSEDLEEDENNGMEEEINEMLDEDRDDSSCDDSSTINELKNRLEDDFDGDHGIDEMDKKIEEMLSGSSSDPICCDSDIMNEIRDRLEDEFDDYENLCDPCDDVDITANISADPEEVYEGGSTTLEWSSENATYCEGDNFDVASSTNGSTTVDNIQDDTTFTLNCYDDEDNQADDSVTVTVKDEPTPPELTANISADPEEVYEGGSTTLEWSSENATYCEGDNFDVASSTNGSTTVDNIQDDTTFTLNCYDDEDNQADDSVTVTVKDEPTPPELTANISADPEEVYEGGSTTLEWSSENATYCEGDNFDVASSTNGSTTVDNIQDDTTFTLNCYDDEDNQADDSVTVTVKEQKKDDTGSIRICKMIVDENGDIVTDSDGLPDGEFEISLYNSYEQGDEIASFALESGDFTPNTSIIGDENDAHCETFDGLELHSGSIDHKNDGFFYTEEAVDGELWESVGYNDQFNTDVESTGDFYSYDDLFVGGELKQDRNKNSDGHITLSENNSDRTLVVLNKHEEKEPTPPELTANISADPEEV
ncbi:MAG: hypothetical protein ACLFNN_01835, partial [Candidatus Paceibacterota bacterium]